MTSWNFSVGKNSVVIYITRRRGSIVSVYETEVIRNRKIESNGNHK
jgi:hypothetical protein